MVEVNSQQNNKINVYNINHGKIIFLLLCIYNEKYEEKKLNLEYYIGCAYL